MGASGSERRTRRRCAFLGAGVGLLAAALLASWPLLRHAWLTAAPLASDDELAGAVAIPSCSSSALRALADADQAARQGPIDWERLRVEDARRRVIVRAWDAAGALQSAEDRWRAALILQHGRSVDDFAHAHRLAASAVALGYAPARWLAAATEDRWLLARDLPQRWGTQYQEVDGRWELAPVDPAVTDEERTAHGLPTLAEARAAAAGMGR